MRVSIGIAAAAAVALSFANVSTAAPTTTGFGGFGGNEQLPPPAANYQIDDGTAEDAVGFGPTGTGNDLIWMTTFPKVAGAELITTISAAYGTPAFPGSASNGTPIRVLLWHDPDGGSPQNAILLSDTPGVTAGANTNTYVTYDIPDTVVPSGTLVVGILMANSQGATNPYPCALDETTYTPNRSYIGFGAANTVNPANMVALGANFLEEGAIAPGNWLVRAHGEAVPEPASLGLLGLGAVLLGARRRA